ncbi:hypothetical protein CRG98_017345 [Punica granatum]|uniref:Uncharacterized protein n=1 Tax=Punica granatum TaxID=22663 RepID=A0A2I0K122_PUNGR|nr:hypothetical protein CRG98_017345 [Punica granatum]
MLCLMKNALLKESAFAIGTGACPTSCVMHGCLPDGLQYARAHCLVDCGVHGRLPDGFCNMHGRIALWIAGCMGACPAGFAICTGALPYGLRDARALARRIAIYTGAYLVD